jgi:exodeoxyribonuclease-3
VVLAGDYNVIPTDDDVKNPADWIHDALFQPESKAAWRTLKNLGLTDAYELADGRPRGFTFWDYQAGAWQRNNGIRIDHALLSPQAADRLKGVTIHKEQRAKEKPSDHVPVVSSWRPPAPP